MARFGNELPKSHLNIVVYSLFEILFGCKRWEENNVEGLSSLKDHRGKRNDMLKKVMLFGR